MSESLTVLDTTTLDGLRSFMPEDKLVTLLKRYLDDSSVLIERLGRACVEGNAIDARRFAHSLKSTSANVGAADLSALAKELEALGQTAQLPAIEARLDELQGVFQRVKAVIESLPGLQPRRSSQG